MRTIIFKAYRFFKEKPELQLLSLSLLLCSVLFAKYIFGNSVYIFNDVGGDTINSYYPRLYFLNKLLHNDFSLFSFNLGMGSGTLTREVYDPFSFFLFLLPEKSLASGIVYSIILKILFVSFFSFKFFKVLLGSISEKILIIAAVAVAFCGHFILWGQHYKISSAFVYFPLVLYGFELLLKNKQKILFSFAIAFSVMFFYIFYQIAIFLIVYILSRVIFSTELETIKEKGIFLVKVILYVFLGLSISAVFLIPEVSGLVNNPRVSFGADNSGGNSLFEHLHFFDKMFLQDFLLRLFSNNFLGSAKNYFGIMNYYEFPQVYTTVLLLLFFPFSFFSKKREIRVLSFVLITFVVLLWISPFLSVVINGFQYPAYRWGMLVSVAIAIIGAFGMVEYLENVSRKYKIILSVVAFSFLVMIASLTKFDFAKFGKPILITYFFIVVYVFLLVFLKEKKRIFYPLLLTLFSFEIIVEHYPTINSRDEFSKDFEEKGISYFDNDYKAVQLLNEKDTSFFRLSKRHYSHYLNDAYVQGYNGLSQYGLGSFYYVRFLKLVGVPFSVPDQYSSAPQYELRNILYDLLSVKYILSRKKICSLYLLKYKFLNRYIYERPTCLPLGITYDSFILEENVDNYSDELITKAIILDEKPSVFVNEISATAEVLNALIDTVVLTFDESNCVIENAEKNEDTYISYNGDPQIIIKGISGYSSRCCDVELDVYTEKQSIAQVFWHNKVSYYSKEQSKRVRLVAGENHVRVRVSSQSDLLSLRIDPISGHNKFSIKKIQLEVYSLERNNFSQEVPVDFKTIKGYNADSVSGDIKRIEIYNSGNDPYITIPVENKKTDSLEYKVSFELSTDSSESDCQLFWTNEPGMYSEQESKSIKYYNTNNDVFIYFINEGISQIRIDPGRKNGDYTISDLKIELVSSNKRDLKRNYDKLKEDTLKITSFEDDCIKGIINCKRDKVLFLAVPYHENWEISVDNKKITPLVANYGFIGIPLTKGAHTVNIEYIMRNYMTGGLISLLSVIAIGLYVFLKRKKTISNENTFL